MEETYAEWLDAYVIKRSTLLLQREKEIVGLLEREAKLCAELANVRFRGKSNGWFRKPATIRGLKEACRMIGIEFRQTRCIDEKAFMNGQDEFVLLARQ
jgi:hypothetical protein